MQLFPLTNIPEQLLSHVGGKARGLCQLSRHQYNVPDGFILTDIHPEDDFSQAVQQYEQMGGVEVAVRSSATLEDGNDFSSAGQYSTILNVKGAEALKDAILECVASLNNTTAEQYRKNFFRSANTEMTVVVQRMINSYRAGVIFTHNPQDPEAILIEAVEGQGENLVSGKASAQQFIVRGEQVEMPEGEAYLTKEQVRELAKGAKKAEKVFDKPMDLEYALDEAGTIYWLQARPITVEDVPTLTELDYKPDVSNDVITTSNVGEMMPGAVTPLTLSSNIFALDWGVRKMMNKIGCTREVDDIPPYSCIGSFYNHLFFNMSTTYIMCHSFYGSEKATMDLSICGRVLEGYPDIPMKDMWFGRRFLNTLRFFRYYRSAEGAIKGADRIANKVQFDLTQDSESLYKSIDEQLILLCAAQYYHYWASYYSGAQNNTLILLLRKDFATMNELVSLMAGTMTNIKNIESANVLHSLRKLARQILLEYPDAAQWSIDQLVQYLDGEPSESVAKLYKAFMLRHGHRGIREAELRSKSWSDDHQSFCQSLHQVLVTGGEDTPFTGKPWKQVAEQLIAKRGRLMRMYLMQTIKNARHGFYYREYTKSRDIFTLNKFKAAYRQLGENMAKDGLLPDADLVYFLTHEELAKLLHGEMSLVKKAIARRRLYPIQMDLKFPDVCLGKPQPLTSAVADTNASSSLIQGTPASRGQAKGKVRVVRSVEDANLLQPGEIMVAGFTDIGWSPYYSVIGGLITEIGSTLSHGIVVAREYALPAIVNVSNVMNILHTGDVISMDGQTGEIRIEQR